MATITADRSRSGGAVAVEGVACCPAPPPPPPPAALPPAELANTADVGVWILWGVMLFVAEGESASPGPARWEKITTEGENPYKGGSPKGRGLTYCPQKANEVLAQVPVVAIQRSIQ